MIVSTGNGRGAALDAARSILIEGDTCGDGWWAKLATIRAYAPVMEVPDLGLWIVTGYEEARTVQSSPNALVGFDARNDSTRPGWREHPGRAYMADWFGHKDDEVHKRTRTILNQYFLPGRLKALTGFIGLEIDAILSRFCASGGGNFIEMVSYPVTEAVTGYLLGLDPANRPNFRDHIQNVMRTFDFNLTQEDWRLADEAAITMRAFWSDELDRRIANPVGTDMLSELVRSGQFTKHELIVIAENVLAAATDTTANTSANGMFLMLQWPEEIARAARDQTLRGKIPDEVLRLSAAATFSGRLLKDAIPVGGVEIPAGAVVLTSLGGANRDPKMFADPDRFDLDRPRGRAIPFGQGIHTCLGAPLAGIVLRELFSRVVDFYDRIEIVGRAPEAEGVVLRQLPDLNLRVD